jgi:hypothetical protein
MGSPCAVTFSGGQLYIGTGDGPDGEVRSVSLSTGELTTPAGTVDVTGPGASGIAAGEAGLGYLCGLTVDGAGNLVFADGGYFSDGSPDGGDNLVRLLATHAGTYYGQAMTAGHVYTIAGDGTQGYSGDGGPAPAAELSGPAGIAVDAAGNVEDTGNDVVRVIVAASGTFYGQAMTAGDIYTVAGTGQFGYSGYGGPAARARLGILPVGDGKNDVSEPWPALRVDHHGNLVLGDTDNDVVRVVATSSGTFYGQKMTAGDIYTVAGDGRGDRGDADGPALKEHFSTVSGIAVDGAGDLVVADNGNDIVWVVAEHTGPSYGIKMTAGDAYVVAGSGNFGTSGNGGVATRADFAGPTGVAVDSAGNILISDTGGTGDTGAYYENEEVRAVAARSGTYYGLKMTAGHLYDVAGTDAVNSGLGGPATRAVLSEPSGVTLDRSGDLLVSASGQLLVRPPRSGRFYGTQMVAGHLYAVAGGGTGFPGGGRPGRQVRLNGLEGTVIDGSGNVLLALRDAARLAVLAGRTGRFYGQKMTAGRIYLIAGNGSFGFAGDGGPATKAALAPTSVAVDRHGNIVVGDSLDGTIRVIAERTGTFYGQKMKTGDIYSVAGGGAGLGSGGPARQAAIGPASVTIDPAGNVVLADPDYWRVQVVAVASGIYYGQKMKAGDIYVIGGSGQYQYSGDGGPALSAGLEPYGAAVDDAGNVLVADGNDRVRVIAVKAGTFYGQAMTAGDIYSIAGGGTAGLGDGGPALAAELDGPEELAVAASGDVYAGDFYRVRLLTP